MLKIDQKKLKVAQKVSGSTLRSILGADDVQEFSAAGLSETQIRRYQDRLTTEARRNLTKVSDRASETEARDAETAHDLMMSIWDELEDAAQQLPEARGRSGDADRRPGNGETRASGIDGEHGDHREDRGIVYALTREQRMADQPSIRGLASYSDLSEGAYLRSMVLGAKTEIERRALTEGTDSAGGYTVPDVLSARLIDRMRAAAASIRAGALTVPLTSDTQHVARVVTDPVPTWRAEDDAVANGDPTFDRITFVPRSLAVMVKISRELLEDSLNIETALPALLAKAMALEVDRVALFGSGTGNEPKGLVNMAGINSVAVGAALTSYVPLIRGRTAVLSANAPEVSAYILHPRDDGALAELVDTQHQPLRVPPAIEKVPFLATSAVPTGGGAGHNESEILTGFFPHLLIGMRSELRIEVLKERYADTLQVGFLAHLRMDVAVEHEASFTKITGIQPAA